MSQLNSQQCLFCQHFNPPDAVDCRHCDEQLNLQPCHRCGAVDLRTATKCYRCGARFSPGDASEFDFSVPPWIVERPSNPQVAAPKVDYPAARLAHSQRARKWVDQTHSLATATTPADRPRGKRMAIVAIPLLAIATAVALYWYGGNPLEPTRTQGPSQAVNDRPVGRSPEEFTPAKTAETGTPVNGAAANGAAPNAAAAVIAASKPVGMIRPTPAKANRTAETLSLKRSDPEASAAASSLPAAEAKPSTPDDQSDAEKCPPAVATLGLCNPGPPREKP